MTARIRSAAQIHFLECLLVTLGALGPGCAAPPNQTSIASAPTEVNGRKLETISRLGRPLYALAPETSAPQLEKLAAARAALAEQPGDPERIVWVGRRLGYLWRMNEAIAVFTDGLAAHPRYATLYRHRGHRHISLRRFDEAIADLERAAELIQGQPDEIEPDGLPNARNLPLTTTAFNVWYHLGLARYLKDDFAGALRAYEETMKYSRRHDDNLAATSYWMYLTLRRLGRDSEAAALLEPISPQMEMIENHAYHKLLLFYKGIGTPEELLQAGRQTAQDAATFGYGIGCWYLLKGETQRAKEIFRQAVAGESWPAFGFIAAETELERRRE